MAGPQKVFPLDQVGAFSSPASQPAEPFMGSAAISTVRASSQFAHRKVRWWPSLVGSVDTNGIRAWHRGQRGRSRAVSKD
jgi:hypothetical protein